MKPWVLAVGLSLTLHLGLVLALRGETVAPSPLKGERRTRASREEGVGVRGDTFVNFTPVAAGEPKKAEVAAVAKLSAPRTPLIPPVTPSEVEVPSETPVTADVAALEGNGGPSTPLGVSGGGAAAPTALGGNGGAPADPVSGAEVDLTALMHARLAAMADRCYPPAARRFQQRGTVQLSFCTDANGATASSTVTQSSGAELLDAAARGCVVDSAAPFPREAASRCFSVPVRFGARQ